MKTKLILLFIAVLAVSCSKESEYQSEYNYLLEGKAYCSPYDPSLTGYMSPMGHNIIFCKNNIVLYVYFDRQERELYSYEFKYKVESEDIVYIKVPDDFKDKDNIGITQDYHLLNGLNLHLNTTTQQINTFRLVSRDVYNDDEYKNMWEGLLDIP